MRRFLLAAAALIAVVALVPMPAFAENARLLDLVKLVMKLNGSPTYQEAISVSTTSARTATAMDAGQIVLLVNDGATKSYCGFVSSTGTVVAGQAVPLIADEKIYLTSKSGQTHVACITSSGTSTVRVYRME